MIVVAAAVGYLLLADVLCAWAAPAEGNVFALFRNVFLGPTSSPLRAASILPLPALLIEQPLLIRAIRASLCWIVGFACLHQSGKLNPLLARAYVLDGTALAFVGTGVIDAIEATILLFAWLLLGEDVVFIPRNRG